jgi:prepilin-type processing-associated H-X9-DG protein
MPTTGRSRGFTIVHLLVVIAVFVLLLGYLVLTTHRVSRGEGAGRVKCQSNLSQIGKALLLYANENKGAFPQTHWVAGAPVSLTNDGYANSNPLAIPPTPGTTNNLPAAMFMLVRTQDLTTEVFTCPYDSSEKDLMAGLPATRRGNFTGDGKPGGSVRPNVSYSFINVYPSAAMAEKGYKPLITRFSSDFAIAADLSPAGPDDLVWKSIQMGVPRSTMIQGNSRLHDRDGQNVLYADGHAEFQQTPLCGTQNDNIFTANQVDAKGNLSTTGESGSGADPRHPADSVLLLHDDP